MSDTTGSGGATLSIFRSDLQEAVLRAVFESDEALSSADIARKTGEAASSVSREVRSLVRAGLVVTQQAGRRSLVRPNDESPFTAGVRMLLDAVQQRHFRPATALGWRVAANRGELARLAGQYGLLRPRLFGSVTRGDDGPESDIDILVDVPRGRSLGDVAGFAAAATQLLGARVDVADSRTLLPDVVRTVTREAVEL